MFWGLIMEPNKRYTQTVEKPFHISQAAMDTSTGDNEACQVMVVVDGKNFLVCTLQKGKTIQVPLDLYFKKDDVISFLTNGKCNIHLTGYLDPEFGEDDEEEEAEDEEVPELVQAAKRKLEAATVSKNKKPKQEAKKEKKKEPKAEESDDEEDEDSSDEEEQLGKLLDGELDSDENDDESFKINSTAEGDDDSEEAEEEEEDDDDESDEEESGKKSADSSMDTTTDSKLDDSKLTKSQKKRLRKKQKMLQKKQGEQGEKPVNGVDKPKKEKPAKQDKTQKQADGKVKEVKEKKSLTGGVMIEDLKVGNGPQAKAGKVVQVYYEGRLKQNNKMFDSCQKGPGFKFRLGGKEVIAGWDVGVAGMKVGGKRKIICPASMAYGAKGSPPVIPPNSTLVFEVELKTVK